MMGEIPKRSQIDRLARWVSASEIGEDIPAAVITPDGIRFYSPLYISLDSDGGPIVVCAKVDAGPYDSRLLVVIPGMCAHHEHGSAGEITLN